MDRSIAWYDQYFAAKSAPAVTNVQP
jgi:hypothetical protein